MSDKIQDEINNRLQLKYEVHKNTVYKRIKHDATLETALKKNVDCNAVCTTPVSCENCADFVNNACIRGKKKP